MSGKYGMPPYEYTEDDKEYIRMQNKTVGFIGRKYLYRYLVDYTKVKLYDYQIELLRSLNENTDCD